MPAGQTFSRQCRLRRKSLQSGPSKKRFEGLKFTWNKWPATMREQAFQRSTSRLAFASPMALVLVKEFGELLRQLVADADFARRTPPARVWLTTARHLEDQRSWPTV